MISTRANLLFNRTYLRKKEDGTKETWDDLLERLRSHQESLWLTEIALGKTPLRINRDEIGAELDELVTLIGQRKAALSGRTTWLGGTEVAYSRPVSQYSCAHAVVENVHDVVDGFWILLNGCGMGFTPKKGVLNGFANYIPSIEVVRSTRSSKGGNEENSETWDPSTRTWTLVVGDSGEAWAKAVGKLLAGKFPAKKLVFDLSQIRPAGSHLSRYGWISSGDAVLAEELPKIAGILNRKVDQILSNMDILDIMNHCGVIQTGRRGAEIALMDFRDPEIEEFKFAKKDYWKYDRNHRSQSNNSIVFWDNPGEEEISKLLTHMYEAGGSEPGFVNAQAARARAPWFQGLNPCAEILLGNRSFCNLVEIDLSKFTDDFGELLRAAYIMGRANYRQTCVDLRDGVLQESWHQNNEFLRLCGVGICGIALRPDLKPYDYKRIRDAAIHGAHSMALELGGPRPKNVTTIKPGGTMPKCLDTTEGLTFPQGKYIFNNVNFSKHDPVLEHLKKAGYHMFNNPDQPDATVVRLPVKWDQLSYEVNQESALTQLERYKTMMTSYVDQNAATTISYRPEELDDIKKWISHNWDHYVGVSFLIKTDPTKKAEDLGYQYLPQEVVDQETWEKYSKELKPLDLGNVEHYEEEPDAEDCAAGVCPIR